MPDLKMVIDGEVMDVDEVTTYGYLPLLQVGHQQYYIAQSNDEAGEAARKYWEDLANKDPKEFAAIVGEKTLVAWALGQYDGPGSTQVNSLEDWLDLWLDTPEERWAGYDGEELDCRININLAIELGWESWLGDRQREGLDLSCVCYRHN